MTGEMNQIFHSLRFAGWIKLKKPLDFEASKLHFLSVAASDRGDSPLTVYATVEIEVANVNDEAPKIYLTVGGKKNSNPKKIHISEDMAVGENVGYVSVQDLGRDKITVKLGPDSVLAITDMSVNS